MLLARSSHEVKTVTDKIEQWAKIISTLAIPVVLGIVGYFIQVRIADQSTQKDFLVLAINILSQEQSKVAPDVRRWAVQVFEKVSPVKPPRDVFESGKFNPLFVGPFRLPKVPPDLLEPPKPFVKLDIEKVIASVRAAKTIEEQHKVRFDYFKVLSTSHIENNNAFLENDGVSSCCRRLGTKHTR